MLLFKNDFLPVFISAHEGEVVPPAGVRGSEGALHCGGTAVPAQPHQQAKVWGCCGGPGWFQTLTLALPRGGGWRVCTVYGAEPGGRDG